MKKFLLSAFILFGCAKDPAPDPVYPAPDLSIPTIERQNGWDVDLTKSQITFEFLEKGKLHTGRFGRFDMMIDLDLEAPSSGQITALIDLISVDAGTSDRNKVLRDSEMFFVKQYPIARFHSVDIIQIEDDTYEARGELSLKDIRMPIVLPFSITHNGPDVVARARFEMNRLEFGIGTGSFMSDKYVGYPVTVQIEVRARKQNVEKSIQ